MSEPGAHAIVIERLLPASPDAVFSAFGDPESLAVWMCPGDVSHARAEVDFRVGGRFLIDMRGAEQPYPHSGEYLELEPPTRLVFTWISEWMPADKRRTRVSVVLEPRGDDATWIRLVHDALPDDETYAGHREGWASILEKLARCLDG